MHPPRRKKGLFVLALLFGLSGAARAHDVQASWTTVRLTPDSCVLTVRLHAESVRTLIQETAPGATFEPENLDKVMPALRSFGRTLYAVSADGRTLEAEESDVSVIFDEMVFNLVYARKSEGPLQLSATHLSKVPPDFNAHVRVTDETGKALASHVLSQNRPLVEIRPPSGTTRGAGDARGSSIPFPKGYERLPLLLGLLCILAGVFWLVKRRFF